MAGNSNSAAHLTPYQWPKGVSGNPNGRPESLAAHIRRETSGGKELLQILLECARGQSEDVAKWPERLKAIAMLLDHGGWPRMAVIGDDDGAKPVFDPQKLTDSERDFISAFLVGFASIRDRLSSGEATQEPS